MKHRFVVIAFLLFLAANANATTVDISFTNLPQYQANGYTVGNAKANVGIVPAFELICADFNHTTYIPSGPFTFNVSILPLLSGVRFTGPDMLTNYQTAAILLNTFDSLGTVDDLTAGSYQYALWKLFTPGIGDFGDSAMLLSAAQTIVAGAGNTYAYDHFVVFTPVASASSNQEFFGMDYGNQITTSAPEPTSLATIGAGLLLLAGSLRRRRHA
jgi:hypothetical protein